MSRLRVSVLVHNLSGNNIVRMYPIAKVLERICDVEVAGFVGNQGVFAPYRDEFDYRAVPMRPLPAAISGIRTLRGLLTGSVLYAFKPNPLSLGVGLIDRRHTRRPLVLDIEDLDIAYYTARGSFKTLKSSLRVWDHQSAGFIWAFDRLSGLADERTVGSLSLQKRHGGVLLPHGADTDAFNPARSNPVAARKKWGIDNAFTILFAGKVSDHKGVDAILRFVLRENGRRGSTAFRLVLVGGDANSPELRTLQRDGAAALTHIPNQPHAAMPEILSVADLIVLPQKRSRYTQAQVPGKVYEAMAMAKPIIASDVSDLPIILEGCGTVITPEDDRALQNTVLAIAADPDSARAMGERARKRCERLYSWNAMQRILESVFSPYIR